MFLTPDELIELTGRKRRDAQAMVLRHMGIEHRVRPDGAVVVLRAHVEQLFGGTTGAKVEDKGGTLNVEGMLARLRDNGRRENKLVKGHKK